MIPICVKLKEILNCLFYAIVGSNVASKCDHLEVDSAILHEAHIDSQLLQIRVQVPHVNGMIPANKYAEI